MRYVLWGSNALYANALPIKLMGGTLRECRATQTRRKAEGGWALAIYSVGTAPTGLRLIVRKQLTERVRELSATPAKRVERVAFESTIAKINDAVAA
jgi:hypothetical protein